MREEDHNKRVEVDRRMKRGGKGHGKRGSDEGCVLWRLGKHVESRRGEVRWREGGSMLEEEWRRKIRKSECI